MGIIKLEHMHFDTQMKKTLHSPSLHSPMGIIKRELKRNHINNLNALHSPMGIIKRT